MARTMLGWTRPWMAAPSRCRFRTYCPSVGILMATSWSIQTWWWAFQTSPKEPPPIFSTRTYSLIRWLGVGIRSLRSGQLLCDPIARQEIIHTGHQGPYGEECPGGRAGQAPLEEPGEQQGFDQSVGEDQGCAGGIFLHAGDPSDDEKRRPRHQNDNPQPGNDLPGTRQEHLLSAGIHPPPGDARKHDDQPGDAADHLPGHGFQEVHTSVL